MGSPEENKRGEELEEFLLELNLHVLNQGEENTFSRRGCKKNEGTVIDITIVNEKALETLEINNWKVDRSESFSDHNYITFVGGKMETEKGFSRNLKTADWEIFRTNMKEISWPNTDTEVDLDVLAESFHDNIKAAINAACPLKPSLGRKPNSWWNKELEKLRSKVRFLRDNRFMNNVWYEKYKTIRAQYKAKIIETKRESWKNFCSKLESSKDISKTLKKLTMKPIKGISLLNHNGKESTSPEEAVDILLSAHFPEMRPYTSTISNEEKVHTTNTTNNVDYSKKKEIINFITKDKVKAALKTFGNYKTPGPDEIKPIVLKNLDEKSLEFITKLYKLSMLQGRIPKAWSEMNVIFIPKPEKKTTHHQKRIDQ